MGTAAACASSCGCASLPSGRAAVDSVDFEGVHAVSERDLADKIATAPSPRFLGLFRGLVYDYELYDPFVLQRDLERVERYYRARGFYQAHARAGRVEAIGTDHVDVQIVVDEGQPVEIADVRVEGVEALPRAVQRSIQRVLTRSAMVRGRRFDEDNFAAAEWRIQRSLENHAYAYAKVERHANVDLPEHRAYVSYRVEPDQPATLGPVAIHGLGSLPEEPVRRALDLRPGERYSARSLESAQQALLDLGVFSSVSIQGRRTDPPPPDRTVPIDVYVTTTKLRSVRLGVGVELDVVKTDIHASAGWTDQNFLGGLRRFETTLQPGVVLYPTRLPELSAPERVLPEERFRALLRQPGLFEARTDGYVRGAFNVYPLLVTPNVDPTAPVVGYTEARVTVGASRTFGKLYADLSYNAQLNSPFAYLGDLDPDLQTLLVSYVDLLAQFDLRDDRVHPHEGVYLANELQLAGGVLGGDAEDARVQPQARAYVPLGHATLALRASTGLLFPVNYSDSLQLAPPGEAPPGVDRATWIRDIQLVYFRGFFSGGASSNRGYPVYGVGPHGPVPFFTPSIAVRQIRSQCVPGTPAYSPSRCALPLGGLTMWEASTELRYPLSAQFEAAAFCDASDVQVGRATYRADQPHVSCGVGMRYQTPAGPIRFDVAYRIPGLNPLPGDPDYPGDFFGLPVAIAFGIGEAY
jgi:outer membrane protein insertion porin family/translocation and assembly module TamA